MAGTITHKWDGTVLTVTSDSGTSSADLKGAKGDDGARGAVGACPTLSVNGKIGEVVLNADDVGAVKKNGDTMTGDLHLVGKNVYANQFATNSTTDNPQFALIYGGNDSTTLQMNNPDWSSDNWLRLYKDRTVLGKPLEIGSGGTGETTTKGIQRKFLAGQAVAQGTDVLTLDIGVHCCPNESYVAHNYPVDIWSPIAVVLGHKNYNDIAPDGYPTGQWVILIFDWSGNLWIRRRTWNGWANWVKIATATA